MQISLCYSEGDRNELIDVIGWSLADGGLSLPYVGYAKADEAIIYNEKVGIYFEPLTFTLTDGSVLAFESSYPSYAEYSLDEGETWTEISKVSDVYTQSWTADTDDYRISLRAVCDYYATVATDTKPFSGSSGEISAEGNIMSMIMGDEFGDYTQYQLENGAMFKGFFADMDCLTDCGMLLLPATTLGSYCYTNMFSGCTSLLVPPVLPAADKVELNVACFAGMYMYTAIEVISIPGIYSSQWCFDSMFYGCENLSVLECNLIDISAPDCLNNWLDGAGNGGATLFCRQDAGFEIGVNVPSEGWTIETF